MDADMGFLPLQPAWQLVWAFVLGLALGLLFDVYRVGLKGIKSKIWQNMADFCWWALALCVFALAMYRINGLQIRGFELALAAGGVLAEQCWMSAHFTPLCLGFVLWARRCLRGLLRFLVCLIELVLKPAVWLTELIMALLGGIKRAIFGILGGIWRVISWGLGHICRGCAGRAKRVWRRGGADIPDNMPEKNPAES